MTYNALSGHQSNGHGGMTCHLNGLLHLMHEHKNITDLMVSGSDKVILIGRDCYRVYLRELRLFTLSHIIERCSVIQNHPRGIPQAGLGQ